MGRDKRSKYKKTLYEQAYMRLEKMKSFGESKKAAKADGTMKDKIFSVSTYKNYIKHVKYFIHYIERNHPECTTLKAAKKYVKEWLQLRTEQVNEHGEHLSAWTIQLEAAALNKLYQIDVADVGRFQPPKRKKEDIKRSRGTKAYDRHFSKLKNEELIHFCQGCGFRRNVLEKLKGSDLMERSDVEEALSKAKKENDQKMIKACTDALTTFSDKEYFILHRQDKGGKSRVSPIVGPHMMDVVERMRSTPPGQRVWGHVSKACDVHGYRSDYATMLYRQYARPIEQLDYRKKILCADGKYRSELYACRGDEVGKKLDRAAIHVISIALGHNREDTAIASYVRNF